jgi:hypothetical protein
MKHIFSAPASDLRAVRIDCGWDRILEHFYLNIWKLGADGEQVEALYTSLSEPRGGGLATVDEVIEKIDAQGAEAPEGFYEDLWFDQAFNESSNEVKMW